MGAEVRLPFELAGSLRGRAQDDIGDLPRQSRDPETRRIENLDLSDARRGRALELVDRPAGLVGDALAVDQHVFGRLAKAPLGVVGRTDGEARHLREHVVGGLGREAGEIGGHVDPLGGGGPRGRRRRLRQRCRGNESDSGQQ